MRVDAFAFVGYRLVSGLLSFLLFALLARWFDAGQTKSLYYLLFLLGFLTSALRALATIAASLRGNQTRSAKLRKVYLAYAQVLVVSVLVLPLVYWIGRSTGAPTWAQLAMCLTVLTWGIDVDIVGAVVGRPSRVAPAGAVGAILALACVAFFRTSESAQLAILLQAAPVCAIHAALLLRCRRGLAHALRVLFSSRLGGFAPALAVAIFDGVVLNAPFFMGERTPPELGRSIGVVTRIFVSSVILLPLVNYWSNGTGLGRIAKITHLRPPMAFAGLVVVTGMGAGLLFSVAFALISGAPPTFDEWLASNALLLGFSAFAAVGRYQAGASRPTVLGLLVLAMVNAGAVHWAIFARGTVLPLALVQAASLCMAAAWLRFQPSRT